MDIRGLRTLNLIGTAIFGIFSIMVPVVYLFIFGLIWWMAREGGFFTFCIAILVLWIVLIAFLTFELYRNTVVGLDEGNYERAKRWILIGMICGFLFGGGIITFVIFLISYISFDDAIWPKYYYPPPYYPYPPPYQPPPYQPPPYQPPPQYPRQPPRQTYRVKEEFRPSKPIKKNK